MERNLSLTWADDIVFEILTWLPIKSLMRFKCVSKAWNSLIRADSNFIKSHIVRSHVRPSAAHILFQLLILPFAPQNPHKLEEFSLQLALHYYPDTRRSRIIFCSNHCNGLVCFYKDMWGVYLYNVSTREIKPLPYPLVNCYGETSLLFLGFDTITEKYKLLHFVNSYEGLPKVEILTLGTNSWREIELIPKFPPPGQTYHLNYYYECFFLNGILYWRTTLDYFDFREEKFGVLSPSKNANPLLEKLIQFSPYNGRYERRCLISDEVNNFFMKYNSDDPNSEKAATLILKEETTDKTPYVLATARLIDAPASLVFPTSMLTQVSIFVENIIPLSSFY